MNKGRDILAPIEQGVQLDSSPSAVKRRRHIDRALARSVAFQSCMEQRGSSPKRLVSARGLISKGTLSKKNTVHLKQVAGLWVLESTLHPNRKETQIT